MKETNNKKKKVITIVISIIIILILALAISYAYFSTELNGTDQIVKVGELELVLDETSDGITLDNAIGISDSEGMSSTPSTFELRNNGKKAVDYIIYLDDNTIDDTDTRIDDKYLKYNLNKNGADTGATLLTSIGSNPNRVLDSGTIEGGRTNTYNLNLWITDEVDGNYSGQVFSGKLRVEVSQERPTVAEALLADSANDINTEDPDQTFVTGENPNNYIWYSGKLWRAVSIDPNDNSVKLVTQWNISTLSYNGYRNSTFSESYVEQWLNDITVDGFLGNLKSPDSFIKMDSKWNASAMTDTSKPPSESEGGTIVEDAVGLLNYYEYNMSGKSYLNNKTAWASLTPYSSSSVYSIRSDNNVNQLDVAAVIPVRPSINLKSGIKIATGNGTESNPYRLVGDNDINLEGTKLNTRYSGEYITFGTGENNLYRIVSHETESLTKITSAAPLKNSETFITSTFGNSIYYSNTNTIGTFLNGEYLINNVGEEYGNMVEDNTTWYLGTPGVATNYKLAKYTDVNMSSLTSNTTVAKIGLLRIGELMASQYNIFQSYWTLSPISSTSLSIIQIDGISFHGLPNISSGIKPALNLKENVIITSGDGTLQNPFQIELG